MKRSVLDLYLTKVSQGDKNYLAKLSVRLADRLLFVPLLATQVEGNEMGQGAIPFFHIKGEGVRLVPVFTDQLGLKEWCKIKALELPYVSLLGYELCLALTRDIGLVINPTSFNTVTLSSDAIDMIATFAKRPDTIESLSDITFQNAKFDGPIIHEQPEIEQIVELNESQKVPENKEISSERQVITLYDVVEEPST